MQKKKNNDTNRQLKAHFDTANGEIKKLKIQDELPMLAEEVKKKIKFSEKE